MADNHRKTVLLNMEQLRKEQLGTDIVIECKDGHVHAHKYILISSNAYFKKTVFRDLTVNITDCVQFPSTSKDVMETIVQYLYTAQIPELSQGIRELIQTCQMLGIDDLITKCWEQKTEHLTVENFAEIWTIGVDFDLYTHGSIQKFLTNNLAIISKSKNVQILRDVDVIKLVECIDTKVYCSECVHLVLNWKSCDSDREEIADKIFAKIDPKHIDDRRLHFLLHGEWTMKKETIENILIRETLNRSMKKMVRELATEVYENYFIIESDEKRLELIEDAEETFIIKFGLLLK